VSRYRQLRVSGGASQPGQPEEESWIESENGNEDSAGEKSGEASPSSVALVGWGTRSGQSKVMQSSIQLLSKITNRHQMLFDRVQCK
jgi:hypothetical protein